MPKLALALVILVTLVPSVFADTIYSNGPINGTTDAWAINFGFAVSDTFTLSTAATFSDFSFGAWLTPGDVLIDAEVLIGTSEFGGTLTDQVVNFTQSDCSGNQYGYNVCVETGRLAPVNLAAGTYWLTLQNATVNTGDPVYWDENSGPSSASENSVGTIPSEAFTLNGCCGPPTTPEPSSMLLFASGVMSLFATGVYKRFRP